MIGVFLNGIWTFVDGMYPNDAHQTTYTVAARIEPVPRRNGCDLAAAEERVFDEDPVDFTHWLPGLGIHADRLAVERCPANLEQLRLLRRIQIRAIPIDHRITFGRAHRFSGHCCGIPCQ